MKTIQFSISFQTVVSQWIQLFLSNILKNISHLNDIASEYRRFFALIQIVFIFFFFFFLFISLFFSRGNQHYWRSREIISVWGRRQSTSLAPLTNKFAALGLKREECTDNDSQPERDVKMVQLRTWLRSTQKHCCQKKVKVLKKRWRLLNRDAERHWGPHLPQYFWILLFIVRENLIMAWGETVFSCVMVYAEQNTDASKILLFCIEVQYKNISTAY